MAGRGALGAAVWVVGVARSAGIGSYDVVNEAATEMVDRFLKASDYELECREIVGRQLEDVADHAAHLREGGCAAIVDALVEAIREASGSEDEARAA